MNTLRCTVAGAAIATALAASPAHADIVVGPRVSYYFDNSNLRTSDLDGLRDSLVVIDEGITQVLIDATGDDGIAVLVQDNGSASNSDQVGFLMYGGMINFGDDRDRFTLTAMYGSGSAVTELVSSRNVEFQQGDIGISQITIIQTVVEDEVERIDVEASWQRRINENFAITAGARYERLDISGAGAIVIQETDGVDRVVAEILGAEAPSRNLDVAAFPTFILTERTLETYSARAGVTAFVPFSESGVAFFNGMVHASHQPGSNFATAFLNFNEDQIGVEVREDSGETSIGPDFAVGAQFIITDNLALDIRYRAILFFPLSGDFDFSDARANHGVNVGISLRL